MNLGKQTVKRPVRAIRHSGVRQGIREGRKAFSYYAKSTKKYYAKKLVLRQEKIYSFHQYSHYCQKELIVSDIGGD